MTGPQSRSSEADRRASRRRFLRRMAIGVGAMSLPTAAYARLVGPDQLVLTELEVPIPGWPRDLDGLRVGQISDTHCDCDHAVARTSRAVQLLLDARPDLILLTGDFITVRASIWAEPAANALKPLADAPMGTFAVLGNHDWWAGGPHWMDRALRRIGVRVLRNDAAPIGPNASAWIVGLDCMCEHAQRLDHALRGVPAGVPRILTIHEPDFAHSSPAGFAIQFSGHSHGGQVRVPGLGAVHTPVYAKIYRDGLEEAPHHPVYVSRGVGVVGPRVRLFCDPEVDVLTLRRG